MSLSSLIFRLTVLKLIPKRSLISLAVTCLSCFINENTVSFTVSITVSICDFTVSATRFEGTLVFEPLTHLTLKEIYLLEKGNRVYANDSGKGSQACPLLKRCCIAAGLFHAENLERIGVKPIPSLARTRCALCVVFSQRPLREPEAFRTVAPARGTLSAP